VLLFSAEFAVIDGVVERLFDREDEMVAVKLGVLERDNVSEVLWERAVDSVSDTVTFPEAVAAETEGDLETLSGCVSLVAECVWVWERLLSLLRVSVAVLDMLSISVTDDERDVVESLVTVRLDDFSRDAEDDREPDRV
jgi:hypothetical protein